MFFPNSTLLMSKPITVVHHFELREANRLTCQSFDPGSEDPVFAHNLLGDMFADLMPVNIQVARVSRLSSV